MNCKPGDIAIIYRTRAPDGTHYTLDEIQDRIVQVAEPLDLDGIPGWWLADVRRVKAASGYTNHLDIDIDPGDTVGIQALPDACLRPIRDPGDAAVDEMVQMFTAKIPEGVQA